MKTSLKTKTGDATPRFRVELKYTVAIGPGKADILQGIAETGSISQTAKQLEMSYQRAWTLVNALNNDFLSPLVETQRGGSARGGASLTEMGKRVLTIYRETEEAAQRATSKRLPELLALLKPEVLEG